MKRFEIIEKQEQWNCGENWLNILVKDNQENIQFWLDCSLIDGYGYHDNFKTKELYIDWDFNQYIFYTDYEEDCRQEEYQQNGDNIDAIQEFIDEHNDELVAILRH